MLKSEAGRGSVEVDLPAGATVAEAASEAGRIAGIGELVSRMPLAHALNLEYVEPESVVRDGDEVALIPPVSGGAPLEREFRVHAAITEAPISADRVTSLAGDPRAGAIVVFHGVTREVERLDYEAYAEMAEPVLTEILHEVAAAHSLTAIAAEHRVGSVPRGEQSIVIAASAPHRPEAFAGARAAIDQIKQRLPVWKKEVEGESAAWVAGAPVEAAKP